MTQPRRLRPIRMSPPSPAESVEKRPLAWSKVVWHCGQVCARAALVATKEWPHTGQVSCCPLVPPCASGPPKVSSATVACLARLDCASFSRRSKRSMSTSTVGALGADSSLGVPAMKGWRAIGAGSSLGRTLSGGMTPPCERSECGRSSTAPSRGGGDAERAGAGSAAWREVSALGDSEAGSSGTYSCDTAAAGRARAGVAAATAARGVQTWLQITQRMRPLASGGASLGALQRGQDTRLMPHPSSSGAPRAPATSVLHGRAANCAGRRAPRRRPAAPAPPGA